jgi:thioredoxin 2
MSHLDAPTGRRRFKCVIVPCSSCSRLNRLPASRLRDKAHCAACKASILPLAHPVPIAAAEDFEEVIAHAPVPVLVDFWAAWCGPCRMVAPELESIARERAGGVVVAKVDTEALPEVAGRFGIRSIPTMILFKDGREAQRLTGAMRAATITDSLGL